MNEITQKEIAVVIPTYKSHKTIKKTLCSLVSQFGVSYCVYIVVDGEAVGSYDYLLNIFDDLLDIKIIYMADNRGPGLVRQYALDNLHEPFITFIDSDDVLLTVNALVTMYKAFSPEDVMIITPFYQQMEDGQFKLREASCLTWMHGKMYRREFIEKYGIHFNQQYSYSNEDAGFNSMIGLVADSINERIKLLPQQYATYVQLRNPNSITNMNNHEFSHSVKNAEGFTFNKLHAFDYAVNTLQILDNGVKEAAVRSLAHIYINYVGINANVPNYTERVDELAAISYKEYAKIYDGLSQQHIEDIERDLIESCGYNYATYKLWKKHIEEVLLKVEENE